MCRLLGLRVIVTIHAWNSGNLVTFVNRLFLTLAHKVILVSKDINNHLKLGDYQVLPAFLPPDGCSQDLPEEIMSFVAKARARGCPLLCANAYEMMEYKDQDLYGLDICVELINHLKYQSDVEASLVFVVSRDAKGNHLYINAQKVIKDHGLEDCFCLYNRPIDFVALMMKCDLVLRPTNTDGDALTIREALYLGLPVIASDAVQRPSGTILFKNRDVKDLANHTVEILKAAPRRTRSPVQTDSDTYFKQYLDLYMEVLKSDGHSRRLREVTKCSDAKI
jgi:hypothetical protein